jgi:hypothetical protein
MQAMIRCKVRPDGVEASLELLQEVHEAFQRLRATPGERFDEPPVLTMLHEVGSYGFR